MAQRGLATRSARPTHRSARSPQLEVPAAQTPSARPGCADRRVARGHPPARSPLAWLLSRAAPPWRRAYGKCWIMSAPLSGVSDPATTLSPGEESERMRSRQRSGARSAGPWGPLPGGWSSRRRIALGGAPQGRTQLHMTFNNYTRKDVNVVDSSALSPHIGFAARSTELLYCKRISISISRRSRYPTPAVRDGPPQNAGAGVLPLFASRGKETKQCVSRSTLAPQPRPKPTALG